MTGPAVCPRCGGSVPEWGQVQAGLPDPRPWGSQGVLPGLPPAVTPRTADDERPNDVDIRVPSSPHGKSLFAVVTLSICLLTVLGVLGTEFNRYNVLRGIHQARAGGAQEFDLQLRAEDADRLCQLAAVLYFIARLLAAICFLVWFYSAYKHLSELAVQGLQHSPAWAVGSFFVPFLNLVRPYQVAQEIWKASDPNQGSGPAAWQQGSSSVAIVLWWLLWLATNILGQVSMRMMLDAHVSLEGFTSASFLEMVACALEVLDGLLLIRIILSIDQRQQQRYAAMVERRDVADQW
jgi:hypothetical protein